MFFPFKTTSVKGSEICKRLGIGYSLVLGLVISILHQKDIYAFKFSIHNILMTVYKYDEGFLKASLNG